MPDQDTPIAGLRRMFNDIARARERFIETYCKFITREGSDKLLAWLIAEDFLCTPLGTRCDHSSLVARSLRIFDILGKSPRAKSYGDETIAVCALLHRVCDAGVYHAADPFDMNYSRRPKDPQDRYVRIDTLPLGDGVKSIYLIARYMQLTDDEALAIRWQNGYADPSIFGCTNVMDDIIRAHPLVFDLNYAITAARLGADMEPDTIKSEEGDSQ